MSFSVRQADLEADRNELIETLQTNLPQLPHAKFFEWLYRRNPAGPALVWIARTETCRRIAGMAAAFPRDIYAAGTNEKAYVLGDFCIDAGYRSLGLAVMLQRACLAGLWAVGARFALDFPSDGMLAVYRRLGISPHEVMIRHAAPLRMDRKIAKRVPVAGLARALGGIANCALAGRSWSRPQTGSTFAEESPPFGEEFTSVAEWPHNSLCVARTARYLNWRYGEHPTRRFRVLTARQDGKLRGYIVLHMEHGSCAIDDLMGADDAVRSDLLREAIRLARRSEMETVSAPWLASHPGREVLWNCGFRPRESRPVLVLPAPDAAGDEGRNGGGWYMSFGDWEA